MRTKPKVLATLADAGVWHPEILDQKDFWVDGLGRVLVVDSIPGRYALNILKFVWREHYDDIPNRSPLAPVLRKIVQRDLGLYPAEIKLLIEIQDKPVIERYDEEPYDDFEDWD